MKDSKESVGELSPAKQKLYELIKARKRAEEETDGAVTIIPVDRSGPLPLSFSQQRMWFVDYLEPGNPAYNVPGALRLVGDLSLPALQASLDWIIQRHETLRTCFPAEGGQPRQLIRKSLHLSLPVVDLRGLAERSRRLLVERLATEQNQIPYKLEEGPLLHALVVRLAAREHVLLLNMHHIIADNWSVMLFVQETAELYEAAIEGRPPALPPLTFQYADFAVWQRQQLAGEVMESQLSYWLEVLGGELPVLELPCDRPRPAVQTYHGARHYLDVSPETTAALRSLARREETTSFVVGLAVFNLLIHRYTGQTDLPIGTTAAGRRHSGLESLLGLFMNLLVLRGSLDGEPTGRQLVKRFQETVVNALAHQDVPFERVVDKLRIARDLSRSPVFQFQFNLQPASAQSMKRAGVVMTPVYVDSGTARFDMEMIMWDDEGGGLKGYMEYNVDLFDATTMDRLGRSFLNMFVELVRHPDASIREILGLTAVESHQLLAEWNDTRRPELDGASILPLIEARALADPDADALIFEGDRLSFRELDRRANQLAHFLRRQGAGPESVVGICMERCLELVIGLLGIMKAGGAYLPLDPGYPAERLQWMVEDAKAPVVLTRTAIRKGLPELAAEIVDLDASGPSLAELPGDAPPSAITAASAAYVIYTSGSTGMPKGVVSCHGGLANRLLWMQEAFALTPRDRVLQKTSFTFDVSVWEFFWPLMTGSALVLARPDGHRDAGYLAQLIAREEVTTLHFVPSMLRVFLEAPEVAGCGCLKRAILSGEALPEELARRFAERLPGADLHNLYGPTEAAIDVTAWPYRRPAGTTVPIGRPIANTRIYLLDSALRPVPLGVPGELCIAGAQLARGYLGRPGLTARSFVPDPLSSVPGERLYRTGDLVRHLAGGEMEFLERLDHQIKVRGFRIELGEIESHLLEHPAVDEAVVVVEERGPDQPVGAVRLKACIVPGAEAGADPEAELRAFLRERLPDYMVPALFVTLESMPRTSSGKIDRRALSRRAPDRRRAQPEAAQAAPRSETERAVAEIWKEVLGIDTVGVNENFFDVGGDSLLLAQVHAKLRDSLGVELPTMTLFRYTTIRALTDFLRQQGEEERDHLEGTERARIRTRLRSEASSDVAIISMAVRLPGARNLEEFWRNLCDGVESIAFFSDEDCLAAGVDPELLAHPNYVRAEAIIDDVELFDASFFGITPREAELIDPQQRFLLELGWEALERAGYGGDRGRGSVGVFSGAALSSYMFNNLVQFQAVNIMTSFQTRVMLFAGNDKDFHAQKLSYLLKLNGPSLNVQTACSSAVVAVHLGIQSLLAGECDMALAGGVQIRVPQKLGYLYQEDGLPSPDGHCRPFDAKAMGTLHSNGAGLVLLKRLDDALADGDPIHAVIKGTAVNNDADAKVGFTAPSLEGIVRVTAEALAVSGVDPATLGFLEAHGTGTDLGDTLEIDALTRVFRTYTDANQYCYIGSVKSNFGHLDTAAGVAGLAKAAMALEHAKIPPTVNFETPNPNIPFSTSPFRVNAEAVDWPAPEGHPRRAAVNVFAIGGTNVYMVLEEAPPPRPCDPPRPWQLVVLSARTTTALYNARVRLSEHLKDHPELELADVAYTLQVGRKAFPMRQALLCRDRQEALEMLVNPNPQRSWTGSFSDGRPVVLLLSGEGEWGDLVPALCELEPEFRREIETCCEEIRSQLNLDLRPGWLRGDVPPDESETVSRARGFVAGYALARLWLTWGIVPQGLFGLGAGEPLAACLAGVLPFADALALALGTTPEELGREPLESPRWSLLSPVTGGWLTSEEVTDPAYWSTSERDAGLDRALGELCRDTGSVLLEVGPAVLSDRIEEHAEFTYEQTTVALDQGADSPLAALLRLVGRVWTAGVDVDWRAVYEHQRRRRVELPSYPFERERFWIDPPRAEAAAAPRRDATTRRPLAEWFYAPTWQGRYLSGSISGLGDSECWLLLSDGSSLADQIGQQLAEADERVVTVRAGDAPEQTEPGAYLLRPDCEDDYHGLIAALSAENRQPARVIHLWNSDSDSGFWSLIYLARALGGAVELGIVTEGLREVSGEEELRWRNASILAPIVVLPHEFPELRPWSADILRPASGSRAEARLAADLLREFGREDRVTEVVYRRGHRYIRSFEPLELSAEKTLLRDDGVYLITDGSAGFGLAFGEFLARAVRAQLVLASSVELPAKQKWTAWLEEQGEGDETSVRIRRILALEEQGARVLPITADITDVERMKAVVEECTERFGRLDGVIHAPAEGGSQAALLPVTEIDSESFTSRIHQRVRGAAVVAEALGDREPDFCLLIASLSSVLGGVGIVADVAADCCLDLFARSASRDAATVWRSILWDNEGAGAMRPEDGVAALERLLCSQYLPCIAVSTVDLAARIDLRWASEEPEKAGEAVASRRPRPQLESVYAAPEDELEEAICAIWEELFGIGSIGIDDDFFALGGHSLLATQLVSRVRDQFEVELLLREALEMPTIRQLAVVVAEKQIAAGGEDLEQFLDQLEGMSDEEAREISG